jgi:hypothetical protein
MSHKRSLESKLKQQERQKEHDELVAQKRVANWLINGTKHNDSVKKETIATLTTEDIYEYLAVCVCEPNPRCAPQELDGTVLHNMQGAGVLDIHLDLFKGCNEVNFDVNMP